MTDTLSPISQIGNPARFPDPPSRAALERTRNALTLIGGGKYEISDRNAPTPDERQALERRRSFLREALSPCEPAEAARCIARLFGLIPEAGDAEATKKTISDYARAVASEPIWGVQAACRAVLNGGARFRPSAPVLLAHARAETATARAESESIEKLLAASVYREPGCDERARVGGLFKQLSVRLDSSVEQPSERGVSPRSIDEFCRWSQDTPLRISGELAVKLSLRLREGAA